MSFPFLCSGIASCSAVCPGSVVRVHVPATTTFPCVGSSETLPAARSVSFLCRPAALGLCILQNRTPSTSKASLSVTLLSGEVKMCLYVRVVRT